MEEKKMQMEQERLEAIVKPGCVRILPDCVFRQSKPAIVGVQVVGGTISHNVPLIREDGAVVGTIRGIQQRNENIPMATVGQEVARYASPTVWPWYEWGPACCTQLLAQCSDPATRWSSVVLQPIWSMILFIAS